MLQAYSINAEVGAAAAIPFNATSLLKGCTAVLSAPTSIALNKCGVYCVSFDGVAAAETTVEMYKDGVAMPEAQSTGTTLGFKTFVQVDKNNSCCACASPVVLQLINTNATTFDNANVTVSKLV